MIVLVLAFGKENNIKRLFVCCGYSLQSSRTNRMQGSLSLGVGVGKVVCLGRGQSPMCRPFPRDGGCGVKGSGGEPKGLTGR